MIIIKRILLAIMCTMTLKPITAMIVKHSSLECFSCFNVITEEAPHDPLQLYSCCSAHPVGVHTICLLEHLWSLTSPTTCHTCRAELKEEFKDLLIFKKGLITALDNTNNKLMEEPEFKHFMANSEFKQLSEEQELQRISKKLEELQLERIKKELQSNFGPIKENFPALCDQSVIMQALCTYITLHNPPDIASRLIKEIKAILGLPVQKNDDFSAPCATTIRSRLPCGPNQHLEYDTFTQQSSQQQGRMPYDRENDDNKIKKSSCCDWWSCLCCCCSY